MASGSGFGDSLAVIAAELDELGRRPVSPRTHGELLKLRDRLESMLETFTLCPACGGTYPPESLAQLTLNSRTATLCTSCAITALQHGKIEIRGQILSTKPAPEPEKPEREPVAPASPRRAAAKRPAPEPELPPPPPPEEEDAYDVDGFLDDDVESENEPIAEEPEEDDLPEMDDEEEPENGSANGRGTRLPPVAGPTPVEELLSSDLPRRRKPTAKRPSGDDGALKATVAEVARHTGMSPRQVRQISKLIEEISPPMDIEKSTRYVKAELKNSRSKIPVDAVAGVVAAFKEGVPSDGKDRNKDN